MALHVRDLMTADPFSVDENTTLLDVYDLMDARNVRHVPVTDDDGKLLGIVSHRDLVRGTLYGEGQLPVANLRDILRAAKTAEVMTADPETVSSDDLLRAAGEMMSENKFGCLPVVDGELLVGILTESDFVRYVLDNLD